MERTRGATLKVDLVWKLEWKQRSRPNGEINNAERHRGEGKVQQKDRSDQVEKAQDEVNHDTARTEKHWHVSISRAVNEL